MFAVRSSGNASRLWVGQTITTTGDNQFYCGYTGPNGAENDTTKYKHSLTDTAVTFGTPVTCQYDLQCGDLTANAIYGGAAVKIQNQINAAITTSSFWVAGKVDGTTLEILACKGRVGFSVSRDSGYAKGIYRIAFDQAHPDGSHYVIQLTAQAYDHKVWQNSEKLPTSTGFHVVLSEGGLVDQDFYFSVLA